MKSKHFQGLSWSLDSLSALDNLLLKCKNLSILFLEKLIRLVWVNMKLRLSKFLTILPLVVTKYGVKSIVNGKFMAIWSIAQLLL